MFRKIKTQSQIAKALDKDLARVAEYAEGKIKDYTPVVTGRLRSSMKAKKYGFLEHGVETNVDYAYWVEYGNGRFAGRKMMRKGIAKAQKDADKMLKNVKKVKGL